MPTFGFSGASGVAVGIGFRVETKKRIRTAMKENVYAVQVGLGGRIQAVYHPRSPHRLRLPIPDRG